MKSVARTYRDVFAQIFAITVLGLVLITSPLQAEEITQAQKDAMRANCRSDYIANCMSVPPGGKESLLCLERNMAKLSPACQNAVKAAEPEVPPPAAAKPPAAPPPKAATAPPAPAAPAAPAAPPPKTATTPPPPAAPAPPAAAAAPPAVGAPTAAQREALRRFCRRDFRRHCREVQPGGLEAIFCLKRHAAQLRANCARAVAAIGAPPPAGAASPPPPAAATPPASVFAALPLRMRLRVLRACESDREAVCPGMPPGRGRILACLAAKPNALSPRCRGAIARVLR